MSFLKGSSSHEDGHLQSPEKNGQHVSKPGPPDPQNKLHLGGVVKSKVVARWHEDEELWLNLYYDAIIRAALRETAGVKIPTALEAYADFNEYFEDRVLTHEIDDDMERRPQRSLTSFLSRCNRVCLTPKARVKAICLGKKDGKNILAKTDKDAAAAVGKPLVFRPAITEEVFEEYKRRKLAYEAKLAHCGGEKDTGVGTEAAGLPMAEGSKSDKAKILRKEDPDYFDRTNFGSGLELLSSDILDLPNKDVSQMKNYNWPRLSAAGNTNSEDKDAMEPNSSQTAGLAPHPTRSSSPRSKAFALGSERRVINGELKEVFYWKAGRAVPGLDSDSEEDEGAGWRSIRFME